MIILQRAKRYPYIFIKGQLSNDVIKVLDDECSYYPANYEHSEAYRRGEWDGRVRLFKRTKKADSFFFPVGLIERVKRVLDAFGVRYRVEDYHKPVRDSLGLSWYGPELRPYQQQVVVEALQKGSGVISLPTGSGKTLIGLRLIYSLDTSSLITVHTKELLYQWHDKINEMLGYEAGIVGDGFKRFKSITVAMMQTLTKMDIPPFNVLIFDEAHHCPCDTAYSVAMKCNAVYRYGLSATPKREDGADLKIWASTGEICANITAEQLIDEGYLAKPRFIILDPPAKRLPRHNWQKAYEEGIVLNEERNQMIADIVNRFASEGLSTYVHVERIVHGRLLAMRISCPFISGKDSTKRRQEVLKAFEKGEIKALVSTLLGEGVDIPSMHCIILAHGLKTSVGTIQKIGRALRIAPDKKEAIIVDFADKGPYLAKHFETRMRTMKEYYGKYFRLAKGTER